MSDDCRGPKDLTHSTPAYRRALWIVVVLNAGYGVIEMIGGFVAGSQALKADALDFLGDGSITFIGLLAISLSARARSKTALTQGVFLAVLGLGVLISTVYRVVTAAPPEAELMGGLGLIALIVNVAAAWVLSKFRDGDANVKAVWLFSRNDALGNAAVVVAAGLVWLLNSPWPDLVVAFGIAGLFIYSAWDIIADARRELRKGRH